MFSIFLLAFIDFPNKENAILEKAIKGKNKISVESSGSLGLFYSEKCHKTHPNYTLDDNSKYDWCSNIATIGEPNPWIMYSIENTKMKLSGYSMRTGCCIYPCCCDDDDVIDSFCCCSIYSFSLQVSNDNTTWKVLHKVEKDDTVIYCQTKTYDVQSSDYYKYVRLVHDETKPGCENCMVVNQLELYGETTNNAQFDKDSEEEEESVSIIGKIDHME